MADVKVPPMLHKMSVSAQKAWYKKNKMEYPGAAGKEGRSAAQAKKDVGEINKKKAREAAIAAAAKASKKNKELVSSSERVREMGRRRRESGEGLGGGLETNRDILSYVRAGGTIKAGRLGEAVKSVEEGVATAQKVMDRANVVAKTNPDPKKRYAAARLADKARLRTINPTGVNTGIVRGGGNKTYRMITGKAPPYQLKPKTGVSEEIGMNKETASQKEPPFTPDKKVVRRGPGGPMSQAKWLAKQAMMKKMKELKKEEVEQTDEALRVRDDTGSLGNLKKAKPGASLMGQSHAQDTRTAAARDIGDIRKKTAGNPAARKAAMSKAGYSVVRTEEVEYIEEKLTAADPASKWISDFVASDNPKFEGKSKKERIRMALGAYYSATGKGRNNEELELIEAKKMKKDDEYEDDDIDDEEDEMEDDEEEDDDEDEMKMKKKKMDEKYMGFSKLVSTIKAKGGARDPAAVAAAIGRKKYGKEKFQAAAAAGKKMSEAALDPVGREDKDIDNDGDSDKTDVYLSKRRKAISSAIRKKVAGKMGK